MYDPQIDLDENVKKSHPVEYEMIVKFNKDGVMVTFSGETVTFSQTGIVRPRHLRIVNVIIDMMRQYTQDNK